MDAPIHPAADTFARLLADRHSCRGFRPDAVPRETIERIVGMAQRTPSWCNSQPWRVTISRSVAATERLRSRLLAHVQEASFDPLPGRASPPDFAWPAEYRGVYQARRRECGLQLYEAVGVARGDRAAAEAQRLENFRFFGAPHVAIVSSDALLGVYGAIDCGAYVGNFMLAAHSLGIAAIAQAALAAFPDFWRGEMGLGADRAIVCGVSFGFEDAGHPANQFQTSRADVAEAVTWFD